MLRIIWTILGKRRRGSVERRGGGHRQISCDANTKARGLLPPPPPISAKDPKIDLSILLLFAKNQCIRAASATENSTTTHPLKQKRVVHLRYIIRRRHNSSNCSADTMG